jgi:hypothetical protein
MDEINDTTATEQLNFFMVLTMYSITMNTLSLYLYRMPLQYRTKFAPENKAYISFFGSGIEKIHIYQTDCGSNTGVVGRICKEFRHVSCDNLIIFKCTILERYYATKFLLIKKEYFNSGLHSTQ